MTGEFSARRVGLDHRCERVGAARSGHACARARDRHPRDRSAAPSLCACNPRKVVLPIGQTTWRCPSPTRIPRRRSTLCSRSCSPTSSAACTPRARGCPPSASCRASSAHRVRRFARRCAGSASGTWSSPAAARAWSSGRTATGRSRCSPAYLRVRQARARPADDRPDPARHARGPPRGRARGDQADRAADPQGRHRDRAAPRWPGPGRCATRRATRARTSRSCGSIAEAARFTPGLWLLNRIAKLWIDAASELSLRGQAARRLRRGARQVLRPRSRTARPTRRTR